MSPKNDANKGTLRRIKTGCSDW